MANREDFHTMPGHLIRRAHQISAAIFMEECADHNVTPVQYACLSEIARQPGVDATRLASAVAFDRSTLGNVLERLEAMARAEDPRVKEVMASLVGTWEVIMVARSDGHLAADVRPLVRLSVTVIAEKGDRRERGSAGGGGRFGYDHFLELDGLESRAFGYVREAVRQALVNLEAIDAPAGTMPVVSLFVAGDPDLRGFDNLDFDPATGALFPYLGGRGVETCPSLNYALAAFKLKASGAAYGYGYNFHLSSPASQPPVRIPHLARPSEVALLADAAQVNTFQSPASPENPMLEEFYYINASEPTVHFRHARRANVVFCDGHVASEPPLAGSIDARMPAHVIGRLRPDILLP